MHCGQQSELMGSYLIFNQGVIFTMINYLVMTKLMIPMFLFLYRGVHTYSYPKSWAMYYFWHSMSREQWMGDWLVRVVYIYMLGTLDYFVPIP